MAAYENWGQAANQGGGTPLPQAQPLAPAQAPTGSRLPQAQPIPQSQPYPQAHPVPQGQPLPQARPVVPGQPLPQMYPQTAPQGQPQYRPQPVPAGARPATAPRGARPAAVRAPSEEEQPETDVTEVAARNAPPWLISALVHMVFLIILGLWLLPPLIRKNVTLVVPDDRWAEKLGDQLEFDTPLGVKDLDKVEEPVLTPDNLPEVEDPFAAPSMLDPAMNGHTATSDEKVDQIGLALTGRQVGMKKSLLGAYGGNKVTEAAVMAGLEWLARQQRRDGSWSLLGPYRGGAATNDDNPEAATGLALLAFQGHGDTHLEGKFKKNVADGWKWLLKQQDGTGNFFHEGAHPHPFYTQGICTIAICELYGMTKDAQYKEPAERAIKYCLASQAPEGGWRYQPQIDSDVSVTGWIVMAMQSARMGGLEIPPDHFRRVERFLDRVGTSDGVKYRYQQGKEPTLAMTAEAILCRQYLGWPKTDDRMVKGMEWITQDGNLIDFAHRRNTYYWYYATQVCHHWGDPYWKKWNTVMRQVVPEAQVKKGAEAGSWAPDLNDPYEAHGGRLYSTCLCIYMLEVYYRHLPIYSKVYGLLGKPKNLLPEPEKTE